MAADHFLIFSAHLPVSSKEAFAWHLRTGALERLLPPWRKTSFLFPPGSLEEFGSQVGLKVKWGPFSFRWILEHRDLIPDQEFTDVQIKGPFVRYTHRHRFLPIDSLSSQLLDEITYALPLNLFRHSFEKECSRYFAWRHAIVTEDLKTIDRYPQTPLRILLSGSSGFIGSKIKLFLQLCGHEVIPLVRTLPSKEQNVVYWDPTHGNFQKEAFEGFDAVIHLAGSSLVKQRWTKERKKELFLSRCRDTWLLSQVLSRLYQPPKTIISASAVGFYGDRGDEQLTEESGQGTGFLADLCGHWEKGLEAIENRGTRVVRARFGIVLGDKGLLGKILPIFKWGLGGKLGSGKQKLSWIGIDDLVGALYHILMTEAMEGPVNVVAPHPVSQAEFTQILAAKLRRPAFCSVSAAVLKLTLGEMANELILQGQHVLPQKLLQSGYTFRYPDLKTALDYVI